MSDPTVTMSVALVERWLDIVSECAADSQAALVRDGLSSVAGAINEALAAGAELTGPDFESMLGEVLEAVQLQGGRQGHATADRAGVDAALAALRELGPLLAPQAGAVTLAQLREAVRVQDLVIELQLVDPRRISVVTETLENYPVPAIPSEGFVLQLPDRRLAVVTRPPRFVGRATIIQAKVWGHQPESDRF